MFCKRCQTEKPNDDFRLKKSGYRETKCRACEREYQREWYWRNPEKGRLKAAASMKRLRSDPERRPKHLEKVRAYWRAKGRDKEREYVRKYQQERPWEWRVRTARRINPEISLEWIKSQWERQAGRCALTGRPLDIRTVEIDHVMPRARGGTDDLSNLRLASSDGNMAKRAMTDVELVALCKDILKTLDPELIGKAIMQAEGMTA